LEDGNRIENTWYVLDPNGQLAALYTFNKNENPKASFAPIYSVKRLGIYQYPNDNPAHIRPEDKHYEMHNHLGDVVATINGSLSRNLADGSGEIMVENMAEYYPYGLTMPTLDVGNYRFGFNGMEKDRKGEYTTEYRQYDARIGRWKSVDALAQKYPGLSPFIFANNNPISIVDPSGLSGETPVVSAEVVWKDYLKHNQTYTNEDGSYNREAMFSDNLINEQELNASAEDFNSKIGYQALLRATARSINERMPNKNAVSIHQAGRDQLYADFARVNGWQMVDSRWRPRTEINFEDEDGSRISVVNFEEGSHINILNFENGSNVRVRRGVSTNPVEVGLSGYNRGVAAVDLVKAIRGTGYFVARELPIIGTSIAATQALHGIIQDFGRYERGNIDGARYTARSLGRVGAFGLSVVPFGDDISGWALGNYDNWIYDDNVEY
jgi:RHS repeat-associated protein